MTMGAREWPSRSFLAMNFGEGARDICRPSAEKTNQDGWRMRAWSWEARRPEAMATRKRALRSSCLGAGASEKSGPRRYPSTLRRDQNTRGRLVEGRWMKKPLLMRSRTLFLISMPKPNRKGSAKAAAYVEMVGAARLLEWNIYDRNS